MYMVNPKHHRAIWLSDIHLGTRGCKAEYLLDFLGQSNPITCIWSAISSMAGS
jgi:hypothetical protein